MNEKTNKRAVITDEDKDQTGTAPAQAVPEFEAVTTTQDPPADKPKEDDVPLSAGLGGAYKMQNGKRVPVTDEE